MYLDSIGKEIDLNRSSFGMYAEAPMDQVIGNCLSQCFQGIFGQIFLPLVSLLMMVLFFMLLRQKLRASSAI